VKSQVPSESCRPRTRQRPVSGNLCPGHIIVETISWYSEFFNTLGPDALIQDFKFPMESKHFFSRFQTTGAGPVVLGKLFLSLFPF
jgi:hypothetical protein